MTKCAFCFTDAGDQTCKLCGDPACDRHLDDDETCPQSHKPFPADEEGKEEETPEKSPRPKRRSSRSKSKA